MNPYESPPETQIGNGLSASKLSQPIGPFFVAVLFISASLLGFSSIFIPSVRAATMPRFGWIGLILCLNPLISLLPWFRRPTRSALIGSALMTFSIGAINILELIYTGTVPIVVNEFNDRLHSSWLWSVLSFFAVGSYLSLLSKITTPPPIQLIEGEQTDAYLGCGPAHVPFQNELATLIGIWESGGKIALMVEREGDTITIQNPKNEVWRVELTDAQVVEHAISFTQRYYLINGSSHPFNGVACECMINSQKGNSDEIVYALTTKYSKHFAPSLMQRAKPSVRQG